MRRMKGTELQLTLAGFAHRVEKLVDRVRGPVAATDPVIDPYIGYSTPSGAVVRGRVLSRKQMTEARKAPSMFANMLAMARNFATDEIADAKVAAGGMTSKTDEEGYFTIDVPHGSVSADGTVTVTLPDFGVDALATVVIAAKDAEFGIISDIDDTVIRTGAWALYRNIWTTFTQSVSTRHVHADTRKLLDRLHAQKNPVFYVSSSPWNLHTYLVEVFRRDDVVQGPLFLRDLGITETQFIKGSHGEHKGSAIDTIMAANPHLDFILVGDTGQHDAAVYLSAVERHGSRVRGVMLRAAGKLDENDMSDVRKLRDAGVRSFVGATFDDAPEMHQARQ